MKILYLFFCYLKSIYILSFKIYSHIYIYIIKQDTIDNEKTVIMKFSL